MNPIRDKTPLRALTVSNGTRKLKPKYIIGIDEVGRGPLAGPVAVGAVLIYAEHYRRVSRIFPVIKDSKKLSAKKREEWLVKIREAEQNGLLKTAVSFVSVSVIDKNGIVSSIQEALINSLRSIQGLPLANYSTQKTIQGLPLDEIIVLLDGGLRAPAQYENQETIIKGDEKELVIALASIVAKVTRDARMIKLGKKFPEYGFEQHKGYGTLAHYVAIKKHGITSHHRRSFLKKLF